MVQPTNSDSLTEEDVRTIFESILSDQCPSRLQYKVIPAGPIPRLKPPTCVFEGTIVELYLPRRMLRLSFHPHYITPMTSIQMVFILFVTSSMTTSLCIYVPTFWRKGKIRFVTGE